MNMVQTTWRKQLQEITESGYAGIHDGNGGCLTLEDLRDSVANLDAVVLEPEAGFGPCDVAWGSSVYRGLEATA